MLNKLPCVIEKSGNYYLSKNLDFEPDDGNNVAIHINANNVILNGNKYYINLKNENTYCIIVDSYLPDIIISNIHIFNIRIYAYDPNNLILNHQRYIIKLDNCRTISLDTIYTTCYDGTILLINSICDDV
jgi:hypothetical protein